MNYSLYTFLVFRLFPNISKANYLYFIGNLYIGLLLRNYYY